MKSASFGPQMEITSVEFFEKSGSADIAMAMELAEKEVEKVIAGLPEDIKQSIMKQRRDELTYASSV